MSRELTRPFQCLDGAEQFCERNVCIVKSDSSSADCWARKGSVILIERWEIAFGMGWYLEARCNFADSRQELLGVEGTALLSFLRCKSEATSEAEAAIEDRVMHMHATTVNPSGISAAQPASLEHGTVG